MLLVLKSEFAVRIGLGVGACINRVVVAGLHITLLLCDLLPWKMEIIKYLCLFSNYLLYLNG